jgi:hypothetical protein
MKNKTAMQEFSEWLKAYEYELPLELQIKAKECLAMEKEQMIKSIIDTIVGSNDIYDKEYPEVRKVAEQYYNKTYEQ